MNTAYLAIDPGSKGYAAILYPDGTIHTVPLCGLSPAQIYTELSAQANTIKERGWLVVAVIEHVHAIFGSSAKATFQFGQNFGTLIGIISAMQIPLHLIPPRKWQSSVWTAADRHKDEGGRINPKRTSLNAARRIYPKEDLRRTQRCSMPDDNKVDAMLIAYYARKSNL